MKGAASAWRASARYVGYWCWQAEGRCSLERPSAFMGMCTFRRAEYQDARVSLSPLFANGRVCISQTIASRDGSAAREIHAFAAKSWFLSSPVALISG